MARSSKTEQELIIGLGILRDNRVEGAFSHLTENFQGWLVDVATSIPAHHRWFSKCWDQVIFVVLVHGSLKFIIAAHECVGRGHARTTLLQLRDEFSASLSRKTPSSPSSQVVKIERRLEGIAFSMRGVVPPRKVLILYQGAPKKFLTKEEQAPEFLDQGKSRLQKELEDFDKDEDGFVFSLDKSKKPEGTSREGDEEDDDDFVFNIPSRNPQQQQQQQQTVLHKAVPQSAIFQTPHMRSNHPSRTPLKKISSPAISNDFTWNASRVSPDDKEATAKPMASPLATALQTGFHNISFRGAKSIFSAQFEKSGAGRQQQAHDGKVRGQVGQIAPSGLRWEDEIAAQLAAAGVKVSAVADGDEDDEKSPGGGNSLRMSASEWRSGSLSRQQMPDRGIGLSRISRGFRRAFNKNGDDMAT